MENPPAKREKPREYLLWNRNYNYQVHAKVHNKLDTQQIKSQGVNIISPQSQ